MKRLRLSPLVLLSGLFLLIFIISCGKKGDTGATGPAGPAGTNGDSTSAVIYSNWLNVTYQADTVHIGGKIDTLGYYGIIDAPQLTSALLNTADVKVYINSNDPSDPQIYPLPYYSSSGLYIEMSAYLQKIELYSNAQMSTYQQNGKTYQQYRYMIVPGNTAAKTTSSINWSDYNKVKTYLGLQN